MREKSTVRTYWLAGVLLLASLMTFVTAAFAQTVTLATHYPPESIAVLEPCFRAYESQNPGIIIEHQQITYGDYLQTILTSRLGGQSPDIYHVYSIWGAQLVENGVLATPPDDIVSFVQDNYVASTVDAASIQGQLWGVPTEVSNYLLIYNKQLLQEAGYDAPPTTWAELEEVAQAATKTDAQGQITQAGYAAGTTTAEVVHPFLTLLYSKGQSLFTDDFSATNLTSPEAVEALTQQVALFQQDAATPSLTVDDFNSGLVAMQISPVWLESQLEAAFGDAFEETVGISQIPQGEDWQSLQYAFFYAVDGNSDVQDEAWAFLQWLNSSQEEGQPSCMGRMLVDLGALTANETDIDNAQAELGDFFTAPFADALDRSTTEPNVVQASEIERILQTYIERAWRGELSPEDALTQADGEISGILAEYY